MKCALPFAPGRRVFVQTSGEAAMQPNTVANTQSTDGLIIFQSLLTTEKNKTFSWHLSCCWSWSNHSAKRHLLTGFNGKVQRIGAALMSQSAAERLKTELRGCLNTLLHFLHHTHSLVYRLLSVTCHNVKQHWSEACIPSFFLLLGMWSYHSITIRL